MNLYYPVENYLTTDSKIKYALSHPIPHTEKHPFKDSESFTVVPELVLILKNIEEKLLTEKGFESFHHLNEMSVLSEFVKHHFFHQVLNKHISHIYSSGKNVCYYNSKLEEWIHVKTPFSDLQYEENENITLFARLFNFVTPGSNHQLYIRNQYKVSYGLARVKIEPEFSPRNIENDAFVNVGSGTFWHALEMAFDNYKNGKKYKETFDFLISTGYLYGLCIPLSFVFQNWDGKNIYNYLNQPHGNSSMNRFTRMRLVCRQFYKQFLKNPKQVEVGKQRVAEGLLKSWKKWCLLYSSECKSAYLGSKESVLNKTFKNKATQQDEFLWNSNFTTRKDSTNSKTQSNIPSKESVANRISKPQFPDRSSFSASDVSMNPFFFSFPMVGSASSRYNISRKKLREMLSKPYTEEQPLQQPSVMVPIFESNLEPFVFLKKSVPFPPSKPILKVNRDWEKDIKLNQILLGIIL